MSGPSEAPIVLLHGAWHGSWCWKRVRNALQAKGHDVFTPTLTGVGERASGLIAIAHDHISPPQPQPSFDIGTLAAQPLGQAIENVLKAPEYFPHGRSLFPEWPIWRPDWAIALLAVTGPILHFTHRQRQREVLGGGATGVAVAGDRDARALERSHELSRERALRPHRRRARDSSKG